jgi:pseudaminic acid cytidylyltransferase
MVICIIPARGGSKRIPEKNIRDFCGKPMIAYSIAAAKASGVFDRIVVSTDSAGIAAVAKEYGAEVPFVRPAELSDDFATTDDVLIHALQQLHAAECACCLYATAPFVQPEYLRQGFAALKKSGATSAFTVTTFPFPIYRGLKINDRGALEMLWPEHRTTRSQDLPEIYHDAGQFYWFDVRKFLKTPVMFAPDSVPIILPRHLVQDIDTPEDWTRAERMFQALEKRNHG